MMIALLALGWALSSATPASEALAKNAKAAVADRPCEASRMYEGAYQLAPDAKYLFNAAEVALAARDRVEAVRIYRLLLQRHPEFDMRALVEERIARTVKQIAEFGAGNACPAIAVCGDGVVDDNEMCDDGNTVSGDGCSAACTARDAPSPPLPAAPVNAVSAGDDGETMRLWAGVALTGAGALGAFAASAPLYNYGTYATLVDGMRAEHAAAGDAAARDAILDEAEDVQARLANERDAWNTFGAPGMVLSVLVVAGGVALITNGLGLW